MISMISLKFEDPGPTITIRGHFWYWQLAMYLRDPKSMSTANILLPQGRLSNSLEYLLTVRFWSSTAAQLDPSLECSSWYWARLLSLWRPVPYPRNSQRLLRRSGKHHQVNRHDAESPPVSSSTAACCDSAGLQCWQVGSPIYIYIYI